MSEVEDKYGSLMFFRKTGEPGTSYPLVKGKTCIGSSIDANIRLKLKDERLEEIHCIIDVTQNGIATILNKSRVFPICVNTVSVSKFKVLYNEDEIDLIGKKFKYVNDNVSREDVEKHQASLSKAIGTPLKKRQSVAPVVNIQSTKKTPNFKTKSTVQKKPIARKSSNGKGRESSMPERNPGKSRDLERPKTTSKLIVSKALASPKRTKRRRLSLDDNSTKLEKSLQVSERNILLSENIISSTISEEECVPSVSQLKADNDAADFLDISNRSLSASEDRRFSIRTPSRSSIRINVIEPTPKSKISKTPSTRAKSETPKMINKLNSIENIIKTPMKLELLKRTPSSTKKMRTSVTSSNLGGVEAASEYSNVEAPLSTKKVVRESIGTPSRSKVSSHQTSETIKRRQKSVGNIPAHDKSMSTRRKTEGSEPNGNVIDQQTVAKKPSTSFRKSNISSVDSADLSEDMEILNLSDSSVSPIPPRTGLSSTDSDPFEEQIPNDPRLSLGKASPRKSIRRSPQAKQSLRRSSEIKPVGDEKDTSGNFQQSVPEETGKNSLNSSGLRRSMRRSSVLQERGKEQYFDKKAEQHELENKQALQHSKLEDIKVVRTPSMRRTFRKSALNEGTKETDSSSNDSLPDLQDQSFGSSTSLNNDNNSNKSRRSSRKNDQTKEEKESFAREPLEKTDIKPIFIPQSRPPLRSYVDESKKLSDCLSRSASRGEPNDAHYLKSNAEDKEDEDALNQSTLSNGINVSRRASSRRSAGNYCKSCDISPIKAPTPRRSSLSESFISIFNKSPLSKNDSDLLTDDQSGKDTPKSKKSLSIDESQSEEDISDVEYLSNSTNSKRSLRNSTSFSKSYSGSVVMVDDDSIKSTPENNTSIIILDTPLVKPCGNTHKKLSKTLNSSIEDCVELSTPKSVIKSRRSKSLPYKPIVEEITPVTPQEIGSRTESGFKTPLNTPGLFENIKNSVIMSRSRRRPSSHFMEELNKAEGNKTSKRPRESTEGIDRSAKKRKMLIDDSLNLTMDEDLDASFDSFATDEIFATDTTDQYIVPNTPHDFRNLTDKPLITDPQAKSLTEPRKRRSAPNRRSLHSMRLDNQFNESEEKSKSRSSDDNEGSDSFIDSGVGSRRSRRLSLKAQKEDPQNKVEKTPMKDVGKKELSIPKEAKSPKNDLTEVRGVRRLIQTPKPAPSPKNDLSNVAGVKKLFSTPNIVRSPKNDLTQIPNLRKFVYPVQQNSPRNDLSDVAGIKKLLNTPKKVKSPENDLRNVPNLRKIISPKQQNSPRNDLSDVAGLKKLLSTPKKQKEPRNDLTNVAGVKRLMSTPRKQNSPLNDLTKVPNLRKVMSPKQQNSPRNDLSDVEGVTDIFKETESHASGSDIENNEDLFDKLFVKKPIRTYRGQSLSPITRKAMLFARDQRKSLGSTPFSSPRLEKWLEDQAVFTQEKVDKVGKSNTEQLNEETDSPKATPQARRRRAVVAGKTENQVEKKPRGRAKALQTESVENPAVESPRSLRSRQKTTVAASLKADIVDSTTAAPKFKPPATTKRGRVRKVSQREDITQQVPEIHSTTQDETDEAEAADTEVTTATKRRGRTRTVSRDKALEPTVQKTSSRRKPPKKNGESSVTEAVPLPQRKGRLRGVPVDEREVSKKDEDKTTDTETTPLPKRKGRSRNVSVEGKVVSSSGGGKASKKDEDENATTAEATLLPRLRGKRRSFSVDETILSGSRRRLPRKFGHESEDEKQNVELETENKKEPKGRNRKVKPVTETNKKPAKKGSRKQVVIESSEEDTKEENDDTLEMNSSTNKKSKSEEVSEPVRRLRRKQIVIEDDDELPEEENKENLQQSAGKRKETRRKNQKLDPVIELVDIAQKNVEIGRDKTRSKKQPAKSQVDKTKKAVSEGTPEISPRTTRQRNVNFKKYGSDFTELDGEETESYSFEENKTDGKKKRKVKFVEPNEKPIRKSKRTRK
ncbi:uncharacterized protein LOC108903306 [Anoplophora glabripennis]|nr:uncharacterized protein LOC108903306 [Anoplophora glabripennis]XP_018560960.1 uncharacterized protein LOC108903306 [Anoplophora glabripennis]